MKIKVRSNVFLRPDGTITAVYQDQLRPIFPEIKHIDRASNVEFDMVKNRWVSTMTKDLGTAKAGEVIATHIDRSECIKLEHAVIENLMANSYG